MKRHVFALMALALLAGCAARVAPFVSPELAIPTDWRTDTRHAGIERRWWDSFGDPVLSGLVEQALQRNGELHVAQARVEEFAARARQAGAARLPVADTLLYAGRRREMAASGRPVIGQAVQAGVAASWEVDLWGRLAQAERGALAQLDAESASASAVALSVSASVASSYLGLRGLDAQLALALATAALRERSLELARKQFEAGYGNRLDMLQAQSERDAAHQLIPPLRAAILQEENTLMLLCGDVPGRPRRGMPVHALHSPDVPAVLPSELLARRPDVARDGHALVAAGAAVEATRVQLLPTMRLALGGGLQSAAIGQLFDARSMVWDWGGSLGSALFDGGRVQAQTDAAAARRAQAKATYELTVRKALTDVDNALSALHRLREQETLNEVREQTARQTLALARQRYRAGYASYIEELDAQRVLYAVEQARLQLHTRALIAAVDLYRALGGGWTAEAAVDPSGTGPRHFFAVPPP